MLEFLSILPDLGITEIRAIIKIMADNTKVDLGQMSLVSLKYKIEKHMMHQNIKLFEVFAQRIIDSEEFRNALLADIENPSTEMFRDPSLWRLLRDNILPKEIKPVAAATKIFFPNSVSGDELHTLLILLNEKKWFPNFEITVGYFNKNFKNNLAEIPYEIKKYELSEQNYMRYVGSSAFSDYFIFKDKQYYRNMDIFNNVRFVPQKFFIEEQNEKYNFIFFRNKCIYYNSPTKDSILKILDAMLLKSGYLILGTQENMDGFKLKENYLQLIKSESIYQKKV